MRQLVVSLPLQAKRVKPWLMLVPEQPSNEILLVSKLEL